MFRTQSIFKLTFKKCPNIMKSLMEVCFLFVCLFCFYHFQAKKSYTLLKNWKKNQQKTYFMVDENYMELTFQFYRNTTTCVCAYIMHSYWKWDWAVELSSMKNWAVESYVWYFQGFIALLRAPQNHHDALIIQKCHALICHRVLFY